MSVAVTTPPRRPRSPGARRRETRTAWAMTAPAAAGLAVFVVVPFALAIWLSFHFVNLNSILPPRWFGFEQYRRIFTQPQFYRSLINNLVFAAVVVPVQTALAVALALLVNARLRGMAVFRTLFFMPVVFPMALVAVLWKVIYSPDQLGVLNTVLHTVSFGHIGPHDWLGGTGTALGAIIVMSVWQGVGLQMIIVLAGLQGIDVTLYEAARLDHATPWQQFRHVTLPGLRNTLIFVVMVTTILSFQLFDQVYILTQGGPQNATTTIMYQAVNSAFTEGDVGQGAAITVVFFVLVLIITLIQRRLLREEREIA
jgi:multiple sugar transport system permease protein